MIDKLSRYLGPDSRLRELALAHFAAGVFQGIALALLVPFLREFLTSGSPGPWLAAILASAVASAVISALAMVKSFEISVHGLCGMLIRAVGSRVQHLPLGWFGSHSVGRVTSAVSTDVNTLSHLPSIVVPQIASVTGSALVIVTASLAYDWRIGLCIVVTIPLCVLTLRWLRRAVVGEHEEHEVSGRHMSSRILEFSQLQATLRATGSSNEGWEPLERSLDQEHRAMVKAGAAKAPAATSFDLAVQAGMVLAIAVAIARLLGGSIDPAVFVALTLMAVRFAEPVGMLAYYVDPLHQSDVALGAIGEILDAPTLPEPVQPKQPATPFDIDFRGVSFSYTGDAPVLRGIDLDIPAGSVTAFVGPSGSGKSTLMRLAARFWDAGQGTVSVGGVDVRDIPTAELMRHVSMVFQDVYLFDTTIEENVRVGRQDASDEEVRAAAERAGLDEVIERLPDGWQTRVGEAGGSLSGGERQRVAIARAFLKDAPILLLDEVTSALDGVSEAAITAAMEDLSEGRTVMVIAHRLSTIRGADRIVVLSDGAIEAAGTHEDLYALDGTYRRFWDDQSAVDRWKLVGEK
ncbi:MAG: ABC transporter ATP-binding protein [Actinomycetaceae bacterium]|nr:ABC transporter ATP-binding protein [Actinomycetaceae bacterium]